MVFVDGDHSYEGCKRDLNCLNTLLTKGTPVLCHDWLNPENDTGEYGVKRSCQEWESQGYADFAGVFGCSALYITTGKVARVPGSLTADRFESVRGYLNQQYVQALSPHGYEQAARV